MTKAKEPAADAPAAPDETPQVGADGLLPEYTVADLPEGAEPDVLGRTPPQPVSDDEPDDA